MSWPSRFLKSVLVWCVIGGISVALATAVFIWNTHTKTVEDFLRIQVATFVFPDVVVGGSTYRVEKGVVLDVEGHVVSGPEALDVLQVAYHHALTRNDPLLALEGTNLDEYQKAVQELELNLSEVTSLYEDSDKYLVATLYPINLLTHLGELEYMRRLVVYEPTRENIREYYNKLEETLLEYQASLESAEVFLDVSPEEKQQPFGHFGGVTSIAQYQDVFDALKESSNENLEKLSARMRCFNGTATLCPGLINHFQRLATSLQTHTKDFTSTALPPVAQEHERALRIHHDSNNRSVSMEGITPVVQIDNSSCLAGEPIYYGLYWRHIKEGSESGVALQLALLNDILFYDVPGNDFEFFRALHELGTDILFQEMSNIYICPDAGKELAVASTVYALYSSLSEHHVFSDSIVQEYTSIREIEEHIVAGDVVSDTDVQRYLQQVAELLAHKDESVLAIDIGVENVLYLEHLLLMFRSKTMHYHQMLNNAVRANMFINRMRAIGVEIPPTALYATRGFPSLFFNVFNETVVTTPPPFLRERYELSEGQEVFGQKQYYTYEELKKDGFTFEGIVQIMKDSREVQLSLPSVEDVRTK